VQSVAFAYGTHAHGGHAQNELPDAVRHSVRRPPLLHSAQPSGAPAAPAAPAALLPAGSIACSAYRAKGSSDARSTAACCASLIAYCIVHIAHARGCDSSSMHRELQSGQPGFASRAAPHRCVAAVAAGGSLCALQRRAGKGRCMLCCTQAAIALRGFLGGPLVAASASGTPAAELRSQKVSNTSNRRTTDSRVRRSNAAKQAGCGGPDVLRGCGVCFAAVAAPTSMRNSRSARDAPLTRHESTCRQRGACTGCFAVGWHGEAA
jgi:hypothetical protein